MIWIVELLVAHCWLSGVFSSLVALLWTMLAVQHYNRLASVSGERQGAIFMKSNGEKPS